LVTKKSLVQEALFYLNYFLLASNALTSSSFGLPFGGAGDLSHEPLDYGLFAREELFNLFEWALS